MRVITFCAVALVLVGSATGKEVQRFWTINSPELAWHDNPHCPGYITQPSSAHSPTFKPACALCFAGRVLQQTTSSNITTIRAALEEAGLTTIGTLLDYNYIDIGYVQDDRTANITLLAPTNEVGMSAPVSLLWLASLCSTDHCLRMFL
jgi:hypothetical protein